MRRVRILAGAGVALGGLALLSACGAAAESAREPSPTASAAAPPQDMTCESILRPSFVDQLTELGWSAEEASFRVGEHELADGIQCVWGDYDEGTDVAQMYGWAPVGEEESVKLQQYLEDNEWVREEADGYVYLTENPELVGYLEEGEYGMTYQFAPGWVALADTKSGLALVTWRG